MLVLIVLVQGVQTIGDRLARQLNKRSAKLDCQSLNQEGNPHVLSPSPPRRLLALAAAALARADNHSRSASPPGPHAQILEAVKPVAAKNGLEIKIIEFTDYVVPNPALDAGDLQANSFQNQPYLDNQVKDRGYKMSRWR